MGLSLISEGTWAVGALSVVLTIGLLGVAALGWYVVRCDTENRHAEADLLASEGHGPLVQAETTTSEPGHGRLQSGSVPPPAPTQPPGRKR